MRLGALPGTVAAAMLLAASPPTAGADPAPAGRPKVCLVLSGGGARGIPHIGVLKVLEELRVPVDCIVGTSAGAIIGGAYASGASPAEIERMIGGADWNHLLSDLPARFNRSLYAKDVERTGIGGAEVGLRGSALALPRGVVIGQHLQFFLQSLVAPITSSPFDSLPIQYRALATDFESGRLVVLDHGDLAAAIRASMSVPGAFAPVEIDGALLVDGGLVRNLGIDVAHELGADIVIAVNVGSPLLRRSELVSLLGAAEQTLNILTGQNVDVSLVALGPEDVLITPELGSLSSSDFVHGADYIPAGELAARRSARALAPLSVSPEDYARWREQQRRARVPAHYDHIVVDTSALSRVPPDSVRRLLGGEADPANPERTMATLLGTDDFEFIQGEVHPGPDGTTLVLRPIEKPWGPDYLRAGAVLSANFEGSSAFTLYADQRRTWLSAGGLEWRNRLSIGQLDSLASELRVPFDAARRVFLAPRLLASEELMDLYVADEPLESYRRRSFRIGTDVGIRFGNLGEITAGVEGGATGIARTVGAHIVPDMRGRISDLHVHYVFDGLDDLDFPRRGFLLSGTAEWARHFAGGEVDYDRITLDAQKAFGSARSSFLIAARYQSALGTDLPFYEQFTAGGFQNLSGLRPDQILSNRIAFLRFVYRRRIAAFSALLPAVYAGFSLEGASIGPQAGGARSGQTKAGSLFLSGDSALGPLYLGLGLADGGFASMYFLIGRP